MHTCWCWGGPTASMAGFYFFRCRSTTVVSSLLGAALLPIGTGDRQDWRQKLRAKDSAACRALSVLKQIVLYHFHCDTEHLPVFFLMLNSFSRKLLGSFYASKNGITLWKAVLLFWMSSFCCLQLFVKHLVLKWDLKYDLPCVLFQPLTCRFMQWVQQLLHIIPLCRASCKELTKTRT